MHIIVGLGNPGKKFENTRHNVGFMALDFFAEKNSFPDFEIVKKYESLISEKDDIILVKPQTFMNESGRAVKSVFKNTKSTLIIIHDDIDMPLGKLKISKDSGAGGHKGVESIIQALGSKDFIRLRIGIETDKEKKAEEVVLKKFTKEEQEVINTAISKVADAINLFIEEGLEKTMNEYNR